MLEQYKENTLYIFHPFCVFCFINDVTEERSRMMIVMNHHVALKYTRKVNWSGSVVAREIKWRKPLFRGNRPNRLQFSTKIISFSREVC